MGLRGWFLFVSLRGRSKAGCDQTICVADSKFLSNSLLPVCAIYPEPSLTIWFSTYWSQFIGCPSDSSEHTLNHLEALRWSQEWCKSVCLCVCMGVCASRVLLSSKKPAHLQTRWGALHPWGYWVGGVCSKVIKSTNTSVQVLSGCYFKSSALPSSVPHLRKPIRWGKGVLSLTKHRLHWCYEERYGMSTLQHVAIVLRIQQFLPQ